MVRGKRTKLEPRVGQSDPLMGEGDMAVLARQVLRLIQEQALQNGRTERSEESPAAIARLLYLFRRNRERHVSPDLLGEPA